MKRYLPTVLFCSFGTAMLWQTINAPELRNQLMGDPGPWIYPGVLGCILIGLGLVLGVGAYFRVKPIDDETFGNAIKSSDLKTLTTLMAPPSILVRIIMVLAVVGYILLFERAGFSLSTFVFLCVATVILAPKRPKTILIALITSILATLFIGWLLADVVKVPLQGVVFS